MILQFFGIDEIVDNYFGGEIDFKLRIREQIQKYFIKPDKIFVVGDKFRIKLGHEIQGEITGLNQVTVSMKTLFKEHVFIRVPVDLNNTILHVFDNEKTKTKIKEVYDKLFSLDEGLIEKCFNSEIKVFQIEINNKIFLFEILKFKSGEYTILEFLYVFDKDVYDYFMTKGFKLIHDEDEGYVFKNDECTLFGSYYQTDIMEYVQNRVDFFNKNSKSIYFKNSDVFKFKEKTGLDFYEYLKHNK